MTPLQQQNRRLLDTMEETTVATIISLYENGLLSIPFSPINQREDLRPLLIGKAVGFSPDTADYWLDHYKVS